MKEVCEYIKKICDITDFEYNQGNQYIEFEDDYYLNNSELIDTISSGLKLYLEKDVSNIIYRIAYDKVIVSFLYKGYTGEIWETYNSRGYHCWVVSI